MSNFALYFVTLIVCSQLISAQNTIKKKNERIDSELITKKIIKCPFWEEINEYEQFKVTKEYTKGSDEKYSGRVIVDCYIVKHKGKKIHGQCILNFKKNKLQGECSWSESILNTIANKITDSSSIKVQFENNFVTNASFYCWDFLVEDDYREVSITQEHPYSIKKDYFISLLYNYELDEFSKPKITIK